MARSVIPSTAVEEGSGCVRVGEQFVELLDEIIALNEVQSPMHLLLSDSMSKVCGAQEIVH